MSSLTRPARIALLLSLAVNVVLIVLVAWMHAPWRGDDRRGRHVPPLPNLVDIRELKRALPPERQQVLDRAVDAHRAALREHLGELFDARRDVRRAIRAEPFDRTATETAFARLRAADAATAVEAQTMMLEVLDAATPEERRRLADLMPQRGPRGRMERERRERDPSRETAREPER